MMLVRVLALAVKPALVSGTVTAAAVGGFAGYSHWNDSSTTAFQSIQDQGQLLLISEFGEKADAIVAVDPADPAARTTIAEIDHAPGFGVFATLSPDGRSIAYTGLPAESARPSPGAPAEAAIVDEDGEVSVLADDVDLLVAPIWTPDGASIVVRKNTPEENGAGSFELLLLGRDGSRSTITSWSSAAVFPIDFAPDGSALYFATLNETGSDLYRVSIDGDREEKIAHLSDEIARDWKLSPDGGTIVYTVAETGETARLVSRTVDVATGDIADAKTPAGSLTEQITAAWSPDGELAVSSISDDGLRHSLSVSRPGEGSSLSIAGGTLDVPLDWAPDSSAIAVLAVDGPSASEPGASYLELIRRDGTRERMSEQIDVEIVGWLE